ncbi:MAG: MurR/RpiR family transcriptional regulator [Rhodanobacter sp.]|nr:MAG: MurR/RpiR family transcriptional regulator [Rhodanobacter sp.]TAM41321.1 MAG: MurR/RpiR family transcriptional regulator [Rhodanobacter sp.]
MAKTTVEKLREGLDGFSATERRVAYQLLAEYPVAGLQSATDLARAVGVSPPTVLRLVGRLGFGSYLDFQRSLREELAAQLSSPLAKQPATKPARRMGSQPVQADFFETVLHNVQETFANLPKGEFDGAVQLLSDSRLRIHLVGGRFTDALALYLSVHLRILRPGVSHLQEQESNWRDQLLDMNKRDVLLVFDIRRYQPSLQRLAHAAAARQARIILLTDQWLSPIVRVATHVLSARVAVPSMWDSCTALMALSESLLAEVSRQGWEKSRRRIKELEDMRGQLVDTDG